MPDETQKERHTPHVLTTLAGVLIAFLLLAAIYVVYQAAHILFPQNVYETAPVSYTHLTLPTTSRV